MATLAGSFTGSGPGFSGSGGSADGFGAGLFSAAGTAGLLAAAGTAGFSAGLLAAVGAAGFGAGLLVTVGAAGFFPEVGGATDFHPAGLNCGDVDNADKGSISGGIKNWKTSVSNLALFGSIWVTVFFYVREI